jgi:hypothetical protein
MLVGHLKPVTFAHTPPGAYQNYIYLVLGGLMLALSLRSGMKSAQPDPSSVRARKGQVG